MESLVPELELKISQLNNPMKTKIFLIILVAVTLLSFTLISSTRNVHKDGNAKQEVKGNQSGFALQDSNQF
jgi:hypothetical protein